ncbi:hypothetical protein KFK09_009392 [Dendrobium nobile]|uniref:Uncharacterized protein n=1 Tax=Dendrobium nobile TaxID=94219 RepID=A0A8T3BJQ5_DENNO|nr:hypothetical protein KFK09_009392 [Dendrobium nobile]
MAEEVDRNQENEGGNPRLREITLRRSGEGKNVRKAEGGLEEEEQERAALLRLFFPIALFLFQLCGKIFEKRGGGERNKIVRILSLSLYPLSLSLKSGLSLSLSLSPSLVLKSNFNSGHRTDRCDYSYHRTAKSPMTNPVAQVHRRCRIGISTAGSTWERV